MKILLGDCIELMKDLPDSSVDLTVTSPPYDNLRTYNNSLNDWDRQKWLQVIQDLMRLTKQGGLVVWIVADATIDGSETGSSFRQALDFIQAGFRLHDTMIWEKPGFTAAGALAVRYCQVFEYMFVFSKGKPKTFNPIKDRPNKGPYKKHGSIRQPNGSKQPMSSLGGVYNNALGQRYNVWRSNHVASNAERTGHPAQFPLQLVSDHIISWSNSGDLVLDPFMGSGTTGEAAIKLGRDFIGIERDPEYHAIATARINAAQAEPDLFKGQKP